MSQQAKKILVAVLDWGLGHAARSLVLIRALQRQGCRVAVASAGDALQLLKKELPETTCFELPAYNPVYPANNAMVFKMGLQLPHFISVIKAEQLAIEQLVADHGFQVVVSDNRYGAYSTRVKSVFITHQLQVLMPTAFKWMQPAVNYFNHRQINRFTECWAPAPADHPFPQLMPREINKVRYIGYLSRLQPMAAPPKYKLLVLCSGPEPQRSIFETIVTPGRAQLEGKILLVRGKPNEPKKLNRQEGNLTVVNYLTGAEMNEVMAESGLILTRPGYSTIMDLEKLGKKAIFVPTPGQTEQEYIGGVLMKNGTALCLPQNSFNLQQALEHSAGYKGFTARPEDNALQSAIDSLLWIS